MVKINKITFHFTDDFGTPNATFKNAYGIDYPTKNFIGVSYKRNGKDKTTIFNKDKVLEIDIEYLNKGADDNT